ncbi:MAG: hypothetical protein HYW77_03220 [Parcubacteria group bacterium]|nr:hypothetical protein [Parcubacteria group bacterium]
MANNKNISIVVAVSLAVLIVVVGSVGVLFLTNFLKYDRYEKHDFINSNAYQAVFLTNDQIYFGHLKNISSDYLILSDVYYVKINEDGAGQLVKLGAIEPHGPQDKMIINQKQVLFWENLKFDSQVVKTINNIQSK